MCVCVCVCVFVAVRAYRCALVRQLQAFGCHEIQVCVEWIYMYMQFALVGTVHLHAGQAYMSVVLYACFSVY